MNTNLNFNAILVGAIFALLLDLAFTMLGGTIGLVAYSFDQAESPGTWLWYATVAYTVITAVVIFGVAGYVAGRLARVREPWEAMIHGLASFSLATIVVVSALGSVAITHMIIGDMRQGSVFAAAGAVALLAVGAASSAWGARKGSLAAVRRSEKRNVSTLDRAA